MGNIETGRLTLSGSYEAEPGGYENNRAYSGAPLDKNELILRGMAAHIKSGQITATQAEDFSAGRASLDELFPEAKQAPTS